MACYALHLFNEGHMFPGADLRYGGGLLWPSEFECYVSLCLFFIRWMPRVSHELSAEFVVTPFVH